MCGNIRGRGRVGEKAGLPHSGPSFYEALASEFAHCWCTQFSEDGEEDGFVEFKAEVLEVAHGAVDTNAVCFVCGFWWSVSRDLLLCCYYAAMTLNVPRYLSNILFKLLVVEDELPLEEPFELKYLGNFNAMLAL